MSQLDCTSHQTRHTLAWATSRAASLITHESDTSFIRVKHVLNKAGKLILVHELQITELLVALSAIDVELHEGHR